MFVGDGEASVHTSMYNKTEQDNKTNELQQESDQHRDDSNGAASPTPGDCQLLRRLQADVNSLSLVNSEQSQVYVPSYCMSECEISIGQYCLQCELKVYECALKYCLFVCIVNLAFVKPLCCFKLLCMRDQENYM